jgi:uncharacterized glyoxalase superfamily protein PhnB
MARRIVELRVPDVTRAARFYADAFGARIGEPDSDGSRTFTVFEEGSVFRLVASSLPAPPSTTPVIEWVVDDFAAWVERAEAAGARIRYAGSGYAQIIDPFGYYWAIAAPADEKT